MLLLYAGAQTLQAEQVDAPGSGLPGPFLGTIHSCLVSYPKSGSYMRDYALRR